MSKIVVVLACTLPLILVGCGGGSANAPLLTSPTNPETPTSTNTSSTTPTSQTVTFSAAALALGSTVVLQGTASSGLPVIYASQTPNTCSVSGSTVTGLSLGSCTLTANQAGNASYTAAPQVLTIIPVLAAQSISGFSAPALTMGGIAVLNPTATSGLPVQITSLTPATCSVQNVVVTASATGGTCTLYASQAGSGQYAAAPYLLVSTTIAPSNTSLNPQAELAPWMATPPTPQQGSTTDDLTSSSEGIYNSTVGDVGFIDGANNFAFYDNYGMLFGAITANAANWTLNSGANYYPVPTTAVTANGTFVAKQTFSATAQSFTTLTTQIDANTSTPLLYLNYSKDNGFAASQASVMGKWLYNDGTDQLNLNISATGTITGTVVDNVGGICNLSGAILQTEPTSQHNMYSISFTASDGAGAFCNISTKPYNGLAALRFSAAGLNDSNGYIPVLQILIQNTGNGIPLKLAFFNQP